MEEYVKHIRHTHADKKNVAWCGEPLTQFDWTFLDIDHAAYNAQQGGYLVTCPKCVEAVKRAFDDHE